MENAESLYHDEEEHDVGRRRRYDVIVFSVYFDRLH